MSSYDWGNRCDYPGCQSRRTSPYFVGLGRMAAFYCDEHYPSRDKPTTEDVGKLKEAREVSGSR